jgi:hypothetical protein
MDFEITDDLKMAIFHLRQHVMAISIGVESIAELQTLKLNFSTNHKWLHMMGIAQTFVVTKIYTLLEEYYDHFSRHMPDKEFMKTMKPLVSKIKRIAPDWNEFRNQISSHSLRTRDNESIFKNGLMAPVKNPLRIPNSDEEFEQLKTAANEFMMAIYNRLPIVLMEFEMKTFPSRKTN